MISNPASFFVTGSNKEEFTYKGGNKLYHFSPYDNNLSTTLENNIVLFANDEQHALSILIDLFQFAIVSAANYIAQSKEQEYYHSFISSAEEKQKRFSKYIDAIKTDKVKLTEAPTNQVYIVGWAANDSIH